MIHNKKGVPCQINGTWKSSERQEFQEIVVDIQIMDDRNPKKIDVIIRNNRHAKKKKVLGDHNATLYEKW